MPACRRPSDYSYRNIDELRQMTPSNAVYYTFYAAAPSAGSAESPDALKLGPEEALAVLKERGCKLATQQWVTNHYGLILWKLAAMVCLQPEHEQDPKTKRWCWPEVMRQLLYRCVAAISNHLNGQRRADMSAQVRARVEWWLTARLAPDLYGGRARCVSHGPMRVQDCVVAGDGR